MKFGVVLLVIFWVSGYKKLTTTATNFENKDGYGNVPGEVPFTLTYEELITRLRNTIRGIAKENSVFTAIPKAYEIPPNVPESFGFYEHWFSDVYVPNFNKEHSWTRLAPPSQIPGQPIRTRALEIIDPNTQMPIDCQGESNKRSFYVENRESDDTTTRFTEYIMKNNGNHKFGRVVDFPFTISREDILNNGKEEDEFSTKLCLLEYYMKLIVSKSDTTDRLKSLDTSPFDINGKAERARTDFLSNSKASKYSQNILLQVENFPVCVEPLDNLFIGIQFGFLRSTTVEVTRKYTNSGSAEEIKLSSDSHYHVFIKICFTNSSKVHNRSCLPWCVDSFNYDRDVFKSARETDIMEKLSQSFMGSLWFQYRAGFGFSYLNMRGNVYFFIWDNGFIMRTTMQSYGKESDEELTEEFKETNAWRRRKQAYESPDRLFKEDVEELIEYMLGLFRPPKSIFPPLKWNAELYATYSGFLSERRENPNGQPYSEPLCTFVETLLQAWKSMGPGTTLSLLQVKDIYKNLFK